MAENELTSLVCPSCGAPLDYDGTSRIVRCKFCKNTSLIPGTPGGSQEGLGDSLENIRQLARDGNRVQAIKLYREAFSADLQEATQALEALLGDKVVTVSRTFSFPTSPESTSQILAEVKGILESQGKVAAIRRYREILDVSLTDAKRVIDRMEAALNGTPLPAEPVISGVPVSQPSESFRTRRKTGLAVLVAMVVLVAGILAAVFILPGRVFTPPLSASGKGVLGQTGTNGSPAIASLFYNPVSEKRLIGLVDGTDGKLLWYTEPLEGDGFAEAIAMNANLIFTANQADLLAYHRNDGILAWKTSMPDRLNYGTNTLLLVENMVITQNLDQSVQAYDTATGSLQWSRRLIGYDRELRLVGDSLVVLDQLDGSYTYSLVFLDPVEGSVQQVITPACQVTDYSEETLDVDSALINSTKEKALFILFDSFSGCIQRLDPATGMVAWQSVYETGSASATDSKHPIETEKSILVGNGTQLMQVNKATGGVEEITEAEGYELLPLAVKDNLLLVRATRRRGSQRFELWGVDTETGTRLWQLDLGEAAPLEPPDEFVGLIDETDLAWTWHLNDRDLAVLMFEGNPNQLLIQHYSLQDGILQKEMRLPLKWVSGDFYSPPDLIGWQGSNLYMSLEGSISGLDASTGKFIFH